MSRARVAGFLLAALVGALVAAPSGATTAATTAAPCARGLVALTFDDGPQASVTLPLLDVLHERKVPATFFVVGERVAAHPGIVRRTAQLGFTVGNHSYRHENLTKLGDAAVARTLRATRRAIVAAGANPSALMRPPYGAIDARVRAEVRRRGLVPVLWTIDPQDWRTGRSAETIADLVVGALRPHAENLVLLHDGVRNSSQTLRAVPRIIRRARALGYCFAPLGPQGRPAVAVPGVSVGDAVASERDPGDTTTVAVPVTLDRPTTRPTAVHVDAVGGDAVAGEDFAALSTRLVFPAGAVRRVVVLRVLGDALDEPVERVRLRLSRPEGLRLVDRTGVVRIRDDDPPPEVRALDADVTEPSTGAVQVPVVVRLSRPSGRPVTLHVATRAGTADRGDFVPLDTELVLRPGRTRASAAVTVLADGQDEPAETLEVRVTRSVHADVTRRTATVTIAPVAVSRRLA